MFSRPLYSRRKHRYRHASKHLTEKQVKRIYATARASWKSDCPLNRFLTILLRLLPEGTDPHAFINGLMEHTRKWLKRRNLPHAYVWTLENGPDNGLHVHFLLHIPAGHQNAYKQALRGWLPLPLEKPFIDIQRIGYAPYGGWHEQSNIAGCLRYICKGIDPRTPIEGIEPKLQGLVSGRRCGYSELSPVF